MRPWQLLLPDITTHSDTRPHIITRAHAAQTHAHTQHTHTHTQHTHTHTHTHSTHSARGANPETRPGTLPPCRRRTRPPSCCHGTAEARCPLRPAFCTPASASSPRWVAALLAGRRLHRIVQGWQGSAAGLLVQVGGRPRGSGGWHPVRGSVPASERSAGVGHVGLPGLVLLLRFTRGPAFRTPGVSHPSRAPTCSAAPAHRGPGRKPQLTSSPCWLPPAPFRSLCPCRTS